MSFQVVLSSEGAHCTPLGWEGLVVIVQEEEDGRMTVPFLEYFGEF
jgi:hypothetical protein